MTHAEWVSGRPDRDTSRIIAPQIVSPSVFLRPGNGVARKPHIKLFAVHRHGEFDRIVGFVPGGSAVPPVCKSRHCSGPWMPL